MTPEARQRSVRLLIRILISAVLFVIFSLHVQGARSWELLERIEAYLYDARVRLTMPNTVDDRITIVDIDEASLAAEGQWPWPRDKLATLVDRLFDQYGARLVAFDVSYPEPEERSALGLLDELERSDLVGTELRGRLDELRRGFDADRILSESFIARDVVLGFVFKEALATGEPEGTASLPSPLLAGQEIEGLAVPFVEARGFVGNLAALQENALSAGFVDTPLVESDGIYRRAPLLQRYRGDLYPSLALAVAHQYLGLPPVGFDGPGLLRGGSLWSSMGDRVEFALRVRWSPR